MAEPVLEYGAFVRLLLEALEAAGVDYMIGGAVAAWAWGEPRATQDLDVIIQVPLESIVRLSEELKARDMLVPADIILENMLDHRADHPLSAIHLYSGIKADLYLMREGDELRAEAFRRRRLVDLGPDLGAVYLHSPEDLIVYKLWYYSISRQTKHLRDITAIVLTLGEQLDREYIRYWALRRGVNPLWDEIVDNISPDAAR